MSRLHLIEKAFKESSYHCFNLTLFACLTEPLFIFTKANILMKIDKCLVFELNTKMIKFYISFTLRQWFTSIKFPLSCSKLRKLLNETFFHEKYFENLQGQIQFC